MLILLDEGFKELKSLLEPFGITMFYSDDWGSYERNIDSENHTVSKKNTQSIKRKNLTLKTRIKRLSALQSLLRLLRFMTLLSHLLSTF